ncbi:hypothetical protein CGMCC3_g17923 [Colletotrichum fructicola]|nr:uncharacterized protein CGMCC3_g17923 [Colletotrichum fructicola]KAE9565897.1 hypothetical protein CGMCC3_g17923 [Colletotrichum fructicola]
MTLYSHFDMESRGKGDRASLERERDAWFAILESYRLRFRLERERIRVACKRAEQSVWVNLANQAWCISQEALPVDVIEILCSYQAEIRQRRLEDLQQDRDRSLDGVDKQEREIRNQPETLQSRYSEAHRRAQRAISERGHALETTRLKRHWHPGAECTRGVKPWP